jgi:heme-degrading monooxygenase HmoA
MSDSTVVRDQTDNASARATGIVGRVMLVNTFKPKPGQMQAFIDTQSAEYVRLKNKVPGSIGNRLGRSVDGDELVNVALFADLASYSAWRNSDLFAEHLEIIKPLIESAKPGMYEVIYVGGDF